MGDDREPGTTEPSTAERSHIRSNNRWDRWDRDRRISSTIVTDRRVTGYNGIAGIGIFDDWDEYR